MTASGKQRIVGAAIATPLDVNGQIDNAKLVEHALNLLGRGVTDIALFGTTGEGSAFQRDTREATIQALIAGGIPAQKLGVGIFESSAAEAAARACEAFGAGCRFGLICPPLYFKGVSDDGLFRWFSEVVERLGDLPGELVLYHIPQLTQVPLGVALIQRLAKEFPERFTTVKDSAGDWPATRALVKACPELVILVGHEGQIADGINVGAKGSICALANVEPEAMARIINTGDQDERIVSLIDAAARVFLIGAVKALIAEQTGDLSWHRVTAPLDTLDVVEAAAITALHARLFR